MRFDEHFLRGALSNIEIKYDTFPEDITISIDTRTMGPGNLFVALKGKKINGHNFVKDALKKDASGIIISEKKVLNGIDTSLLKKKLVVIVPDTLQALLRLASAWRLQFGYPVIAITGSVGKTSTKKIVSNILKLHGAKALISHANQNTKIGLAINIMRMRANHEMAIFEVGVNKRGEMAALAQLLQPTTSLITNVGHSHMEGLGSLADIALEKRDIFKYFTEESIGIINGDQTILANVGYIHPVIKFGSKTINQIQARKIQVNNGRMSFILKIYKEKYRIVFDRLHEGAVYNALAATAIAHLLNIPSDTIVKGIQMPLGIKGRFQKQPLNKHQGTLINDCYNANPESMKAALLAFEKIESKGPKIAVLGDMLELGVNSPFWHRQLGRFLRKVPSLKYLILVGKLVQWTEKTVPVGLEFERVENWQDAANKLKTKLNNDATILVKGSHALQLSHLVEQFT